MKSFIKYYFELGKSTFRALPKVRGGVGALDEWANFEKDAGWQRIKTLYKMSEDEQAAFERGWKAAYGAKTRQKKWAI